MVPAMNTTNTTMAQPSRPLRGMRASLERDWERIHRNPRKVDIARGWSVTTVSFDDLDELLMLAGFGGDSTDDTVLRALVARAADDELAAQIVLRRILPGLLAVNRRRPRHLSAEAGLRELVTAAWITIRTYDPNRQPSSLAAALIDGARYRAFQAERRRQERHPELPNETLDLQPEPTSDDDLMALRHLLVEARSRGYDSTDLELIRRIVTGTSTAALADELGVTPRAIRYRCTRIASELALIARAA